jgi:hypothetical protein
MRNKENQEKDPQELVDLAWADMLARLDETLPVTPPPRRRRLAAWWWLAIGGLAIGLVVLGYKHHTPPPAVVPPPASVPPAGPQAGLKVADENCPPAVAATEVLTSAAKPAPALGSQRQAKPTTLAAFAASTEITHNSEGTGKRHLPLVMDVELPPAAAHPVVGPDATVTGATPPDAAIAAPLAEMPASPDRAPATVVGLLPALAPASLPVSPAKGLPVMAPSGSARRMALWTEAGMSVLQARPEGLHVGIGADLRLSGRWGLSAGLRYQFIRQRLVEDRGGLFRNNNQDVSALDSGFNVFGLSYDPGPLKSHWLELPLGVQYRLGNRWQINAGAYLGYLVKAYVPQGLQVENNTVRESGLSNNGGGTIVSSSEPWYDSASASAVRSREALPLQGGWWVSASYQPAPRWALSLGIRQGTDSWVSVTPYQLQRFYGQASVRYSWKQ